MKFLIRLIILLLLNSCSNSEDISYLNQDKLRNTLDYNETLSPIIENIIGTSPCSISVSWTCDECDFFKVSNYIVYWNENGKQKLENDVFDYDIEGLEVNTTYEVYVSALYEEDKEYASNSTIESTINEVPPAVDSYFCETQGVHPDEIFYSWLKPNTSCSITNYQVKAVGDILWNDSITIHTETTTELQIILTGLVPYTSYNTTIRATFDGIEYGPSGEICDMSTFEDVPGSPTNLKVREDSITSSNFAITWNDPIVKNGSLIGFNVTLNDKFAQFVNASEINEYALDLENLKSRTLYKIKVYAETGAGFGKPSETEATTSGDDSDDDDDDSNLGLILGITIPVIVLIILGGLGYYYRDNIRKCMRN